MLVKDCESVIKLTIEMQVAVAHSDTVTQAVRRVLGRMHAREQEVSNALAETSTFVIHHLQVRHHVAPWLWCAAIAIYYDVLSLQSAEVRCHCRLTWRAAMPSA